MTNIFIEKLYKIEIDEINAKKTQHVLAIGKKAKNRGYFTKKEFLEICKWKTRGRPRKHYIKNKPEIIKLFTEKALNEKNDRLKLVILLGLNGIRIPTASAILTMSDPKNFGIIDTNSWKALYRIKKSNFSLDDWLQYIKEIRLLAKKHQKTPRLIDRYLYEKGGGKSRKDY